jgi:uncharacterized protein
MTSKSGQIQDKLQAKKEKVTKKQGKLSLSSILIMVVIATMAIGGVFISRASGDKPQVKPPKQVPRVKVTDRVDYGEMERVDMKKIDHEVEGDWVTFSVKDVEKYKLVRFEFRSSKINVKQRNFAGKAALPVMAMIAPSGKLMVGVSYCEPCRSTTFNIQPDRSLTCNICSTKWDLESLIAWSGACMPFPPDEIEVEVRDGKVWVPKAELEKWVPREEA